MKKCSNCGTTYTDETLKFCLADGAALDAQGEEPTVISGRREPLRVDIGSGIRTSQQVSQSGGKRSSVLVTITILAALAGLAVVVIAAAVGLFYLQSEKNIFVNNATDIARTTPKPTPDPETERLKNELANLQRQLDEKKTTPNDNTSVPEFDLDDLDFEFRTATVDSPGDGFLALRSEPSSEYGDRLAQIPHGEKINVISCDTDKVTIGSRRGNWCLVEWNGRAGWVFDAWLKY
jgi:hypothetical protein